MASGVLLARALVLDGGVGVMADMDLQYGYLPSQYRDAIRSYIELGVEPNSFLVAVIENDLRLAVLKGYEEGLCSYKLVKWLQNLAPPECWGSFENRIEWQHARKAEARQRGVK